jgi:hypothetical protein
MLLIFEPNAMVMLQTRPADSQMEEWVEGDLCGRKTGHNKAGLWRRALKTLLVLPGPDE